MIKEDFFIYVSSDLSVYLMRNGDTYSAKMYSSDQKHLPIKVWSSVERLNYTTHLYYESLYLEIKYALYDFLRNTDEYSIIESYHWLLEILIKEGRKIPAIKLVRQLSGVSLREAKQYVDVLWYIFTVYSV